MAIDLGGNEVLKSKTESIVAGPQFDQEATKSILIQHAAVGTGLETAYTVPAGKTLFIAKIIMVNRDASNPHDWAVQLNDIDIFVGNITAFTTEDMDFAIPAPLTAGQTIKVDTSHIGSKFTTVGWLI